MNTIKEKIMRTYMEKWRWVPMKLYMEVKKRKKCKLCGRKIKGLPEVHHKIPVSKGGGNNIENLMAVHKDCHRRWHELNGE